MSSPTTWRCDKLKCTLNNIGKKVKLFTRGWLPYKIRWDFEVIENIKPVTFKIRASGDLGCNGVWLLREDGDY